MQSLGVVTGSGITKRRLSFACAALAFLAGASVAQALPNLTPYKAPGWSDRIVVSNVVGANYLQAVDASPLRPTDSLFVSFAVVNSGTTATPAGFKNRLYVDGVLNSTWSNVLLVPFPGSPSWGYGVDWPIGSLSAGTHTVEIVVDATNVVAESNESDNVYTKTITVRGTPGGGVRGAARIFPFPGPRLVIPLGNHFEGGDGDLALRLKPGPYWCDINKYCRWDDVEDITGGDPPYRYSADSFASAPPFGMTVNLTDGSVGGIPTVAGLYGFNVCVADFTAKKICGPTSINVVGVGHFTLSPTSLSFTSNGGSGVVTVSGPVGQFWNAVSNDPDWIAVTSGASGTGNGTVKFSVAANAGAARVGTITIAGIVFTVNQETPKSPAPTVSFTANPTTIAAGQSSTLTWSTANATDVSINGTAEPLNGSVAVSPPQTGNYTLTATGPGGATSVTVTVTVTGGGGNGYTYANWDCNNVGGCIDQLGHDVGSAGPFCTAASCAAWAYDHFAAATCTAQPTYPVYYYPPPGTCSNYPN